MTDNRKRLMAELRKLDDAGAPATCGLHARLTGYAGQARSRAASLLVQVVRDGLPIGQALMTAYLAGRADQIGEE